MVVFKVPGNGVTFKYKKVRLSTKYTGLKHKEVLKVYSKSISFTDKKNYLQQLIFEVWDETPLMDIFKQNHNVLSYI